jgi:hypothetical protein
MFDGVRGRVRGFRNQQDEIAIQKAEAAVEYAVSSSLIFLSTFI